MIIDIPTSDDFRHFGIAHLNLAWDTAIGLSMTLADAVTDETTEDPNVDKDYWTAAQRALSTSALLLQQGVEFLVKSRVAAVSPYLLLDGSPKNWPEKCDRENKPFSDFKTIDATHLIRAHDAVCDPRFAPHFVQLFNRLRTQRNTLMHTVAPALRLSSTNLLADILDASEWLLGPRQWTLHRATALDQSPQTIAYPASSPTAQLAVECQHLVEVLPAEHLKRFFGFESKQATFFCYLCHLEASDYGADIRTAQLAPNTADATSVYCFACRAHREVVRATCVRPECSGTAIDADDRVCLTCLAAAN